MNKDVNIKKIRKHWNKVLEEAIRICAKSDCGECPFCIVTENDMFCSLGRLNAAIERVKGTPNFVQVELPELIVNEERGEKK